MHTLLTGTFLKASDGSAATGMDEDICGPWTYVGTKNRPSYQLHCGAGPNAGESGGWKLQFSNDPVAGGAPAAAISARADDYPAASMETAGSQPDGAAGRLTLCVDSVGAYCRPYWVAGTGGAGVLPTCDLESCPANQ